MMKKPHNVDSRVKGGHNYPSLFNNNPKQKSRNGCLVKYLNPSRSSLKRTVNASHVKSCSSISDLEVNGHLTSVEQKQNQNKMFFVSSTAAMQTMNDLKDTNYLKETNYLNSIKKFANKHNSKTKELIINNEKSIKHRSNKTHLDQSPNRANSLNNKSNDIAKSGSGKVNGSKNTNFCFSLKHLINHKQNQQNFQRTSNKNKNNLDSFQNQSFQHPYEEQQHQYQRQAKQKMLFFNKNKQVQGNTQTIKKQQKQLSGKQNYDLMLKLKNYIQELKRNQEKHVAQIQKLKNQNTELKQNMSFLNDKINVLQARDSQLNKLLKKSQKDKKMLKNDNQLIIQSLKKVINEQMSKIIQLERRQLEREIISKRDHAHSEDEQADQQQSQSQYSRFKLQRQNQAGRRQSDTLKDSKQYRQSNKQNKKQQNFNQNQNTEQADLQFPNSSDNLLEEVDSYLSKWLGTSKV